MASAAQMEHRSAAPAPASGVDRWIWVGMAALLVVTALGGFVPDSLMKIGLIEAGKREPFPPILHVHAVLMGTWLLLLLAQATLMATGRGAYHRQLGMAAFVLAPAILISGTILVGVMYRQYVVAVDNAPPALLEEAQRALAMRPNIFLQQLRSAILFALCAYLGLRARSSDPAMHKRMMVLATLSPMSAAFNRITILPSTMPQSPLTLELYTLIWLVPLVVWDVARNRMLHRAYVIWLAGFVLCALAGRILWNNPWWVDLTARLLG